jgi:hypothetical protein
MVHWNSRARTSIEIVTFSIVSIVKIVAVEYGLIDWNRYENRHKSNYTFKQYKSNFIAFLISSPRPECLWNKSKVKCMVRKRVKVNVYKLATILEQFFVAFEKQKLCYTASMDFYSRDLHVWSHYETGLTENAFACKWNAWCAKELNRNRSQTSCVYFDFVQQIWWRNACDA